MTEKEIRKLFFYKKPRSEAASFHEWVRKIFTETAVDLGNCLPSSRERSLMLTKLQEALMWANASIALHWDTGDDKKYTGQRCSQCVQGAVGPQGEPGRDGKEGKQGPMGPMGPKG